MSHLWSRKVDVLNRGFSGYNSRWGLAIIDEVVISLRPDVIVIFFGANDAVVAEGETHVPLQEYKFNIEKMVLKIRKVIFAVPLSVISALWYVLMEAIPSLWTDSTSVHGNSHHATTNW